MPYSKSYNKRTGTTYVYEVLESKWSKEHQRCEQKRKLVGKIDPITGEVIPTGPRGRPKGSQQTASQADALELANMLAQERQKTQQITKEMNKNIEKIEKHVNEQSKSLEILVEHLEQMIEMNHQLMNQLKDF